MRGPLVHFAPSGGEVMETFHLFFAVKTYLGLQLFGENTFNRINNEEDVFMEKAITILDSLTD